MLLIECPYCGSRSEIEFHCGGEGHIQRPGPHDEVNAGDWYQYLFERQNPKGVHFERWCHTHGCGQWFNVARDTVTHEIYAIYPMGGTKPAIEVTL